MKLNEVRDISHGGFMIALKEAIKPLTIRYEENISFVGNDDNRWFEIYDGCSIEDLLAFMGFFAHRQGMKNSDYLYAEYLEGLDE